MKLFLWTMLFCSNVAMLLAQDKPAYVLFDSNGKKIKYQKMIKEMASSDILFFGELHNNPIAHWLQYEISCALAKQKNNKLTLGFEMFETDQQAILNALVGNEMTDKKFEDSTRLWKNYKTDYKPLVRLAKDNGMTCVASNIPRRIANIVFKRGRQALDSLDIEDYQRMCDKNFPVDTSLSQYKSMLNILPDHSKGLNFIYAQAIKDATMAKFIDKYWKADTQFIHFNGAFHTDFDQGIIWYLKKLRPNAKYSVITTVEQNQLATLDKENRNKAKYIICVPATMTKTH